MLYPLEPVQLSQIAGDGKAGRRGEFYRQFYRSGLGCRERKMNFETALGWFAYWIGLVWYLCVCMLAGQLAGGAMTWAMPLAGFVGWSLACLLWRKTTH